MRHHFSERKFFIQTKNSSASNDKFDAISDDFIAALEALRYGKAKSDIGGNKDGGLSEEFELTGDAGNVGRICRELKLRFIDSLPVHPRIIDPRSIDVRAAGRLFLA